MRTDKGWKRFYLAGWVVSAAVMGIAIHEWKGRIREVEQRAIDAERGREEAARRRAMEERLRIARDLHDSLTHSISVIKVQSGVAAHLARKRGDEVPAALTAIQDASTEAVRELRGTLEVLREDDEQPGSGLDRLPALLERTRAAGLPASMRVSGQQRRLPDEVDRAAYRIVQEALTNVTRHAGPAAAAVELEYSPQTLTVRVDDDGVGNGHAETPGLGLIGMRERVTALGGTLSADSRAERGFRVEAQIPVPS